jgi:hypothetical protein
LPSETLAGTLEERSAVVEFDGEPKNGELPGQTATQTPIEIWQRGVAQLRPAQARCDMTPERWAVFLHDCHSFLSGEWAVRAAEIGWDTLQLFGVHRDRPWILNWWGAVLFLGGARILALTEQRIFLTPPRGTKQSIQRPAFDGYDFIMPVWDVRP